MPVVKYPFKPQPISDTSGKNLVTIVWQPKIPIFLKINGILYPFKLEPFVDSGATRNLFPADPLDSFGIKLENEQKRIHYGIGGYEVISYTHEVEIIVDKYRFTTEIDFSRRHKPPLLGVDGFFRFFDSVFFDMINHQLVLKYNNG